MIRFVIAVLLLLAAMPLIVMRPRPVPSVVVEEGRGGGTAGRRGRLPAVPAFPSRRVGLALLAIGLVLLVLSTLRVIGATAVGIPVTFGSVGEPLRSGIHLVQPWTVINELDLRLTEYTMTRADVEGSVSGDDSIEVISSDQGRLVVDATVRYAVDPESAEDVFRRLGTTDEQFQVKAVRPEARSAIREVATQFGAVELVSERRTEFGDAIEAEIRARLEPLGIVVNGVALRDVTPSEELQAAADAKLQQEQANERATLELAETVARAEIAVTQAQGEADANEILSASLTPELLARLQIEAYDEGSVFVVPEGGANLLLSPSAPSEPADDPAAADGG